MFIYSRSKEKMIAEFSFGSIHLNIFQLLKIRYLMPHEML